jgi:hypothetical protein
MRNEPRIRAFARGAAFYDRATISAQEIGMKLILLAAATAAFAMPVMAQDTTADPAQTDSSMPAQDPAATGQDQSTMPQDQSTMPAQPGMAAPTDTGSTPMGGYQPSTPPMSAPMQPGATVQFQPSASPSQAFPPPAPLAKYPICKRGQTDGCMEPHSLK